MFLYSSGLHKCYSQAIPILKEVIMNYLVIERLEKKDKKKKDKKDKKKKKK